MTDSHARVLFIPVSGPRGMGEYARSVAIAQAAVQRWPHLQVHFVVSQAAPYAATTPFPVTLLPASPTFHPREVATLINEFRPALVVFDNAGRTSQLKVAHASGARVVYVSSRVRQRRKAFRLRWMRVIDEHWIAYPEFIAGSLGPIESLKLRLLGRPTVRFLDAILPQPDPGVLERVGAKRGEYVLIVPGGGTAHPGAESAPQIIAKAANGIAARGYQTLMVGVQTDTQIPTLRTLPLMPMKELCELIRGARLVISNGGDTLLQVISSGRPCVAVPIAGDQAHRIDQCVQAGLAVRAELSASAIEATAIALLANEPQRQQLEARLAQRNLHNSMDIALEAIGRLISVPDR
jgi:hypothetical protein